MGGALGFTLSAWVKRTRSGSAHDRLIDFGDGMGVDNIIVAFHDKIKYSVRHGGSCYLNAADTFPYDTWTHVAVTHLRSTNTDTTGPAKVYWDGVLVTEGTVNFPQSVVRGGLYVGKSHWGSDPDFLGEMQDLFVWDE